MIGKIINWIENNILKIIIFGPIWICAGIFCWLFSFSLYKYHASGLNIAEGIVIKHSFFNAIQSWWFLVSFAIAALIFGSWIFYKKCLSNAW